MLARRCSTGAQCLKTPDERVEVRGKPRDLHTQTQRSRDKSGERESAADPTLGWGREWSQCDTAGPREGVGCAQLPRPRTQRVRLICAPQLKHNTPVSDTHLHQHLPLHLTKDDGVATDTSIDDWVPKDAGNNTLTITGTRLAWNEKTVAKDRPNFDAGFEGLHEKGDATWI